jgi:hypothetical protein
MYTNSFIYVVTFLLGVDFGVILMCLLIFKEDDDDEN